MNACRPRKRNRASAIEARNATNSAATTTTRTISRLVLSAFGKSVWPGAAGRVHAVTKLRSVGSRGTTDGSRLMIWFPGVNERFTIQYTGNTEHAKTMTPSTLKRIR